MVQQSTVWCSGGLCVASCAAPFLVLWSCKACLAAVSLPASSASSAGAAADRQATDGTWSRDRHRPTSAPSTPSSTDSRGKRGVGARDTALLDFLVSTPAILEVLALRLLCACLLFDVLPPALASQSTHAGNRGGRVVPLLRAAPGALVRHLPPHAACEETRA